MKKSVRILLIIIAVVCFGVALSYPISEYVQREQSQSTMDRLAALRDAGLAAANQATDAPDADESKEEALTTNAPAEDDQPGQPTAPQTDQGSEGVENAETEAPEQGSQTGEEAQIAATTTETVASPEETSNPEATAAEVPTDGEEAAQGGGESELTPEPTASPAPTASPTPSPTPNRRVNTGAQVWADIEKIPLDESKILPQYRQLYEINNEMVGWLTISDTKIDYPVMQTENEEYYLSHDFFREENINGLPILDHNCDPYTPSYNLVVSGHNRKNDTIFSKLTEYYQDKRHWAAHKTIQFDSLMEERTYVVFAAFFAADYDVDEEGFRYNANIEYGVDASQWLTEIHAYQLYETDIPTAFGDEFLTLTTCNSSRRKNGRFVVVARRLREGEVIE